MSSHKKSSVPSQTKLKAVHHAKMVTPPASSTLPLPNEVLSDICAILSAQKDSTSLTILMRASSQLYDIASAVLYRKVSINEDNIVSFLLGLSAEMKKGVKLTLMPRLEPPPAQRRQHYRSTTARKERKALLLAHVTHVSLEEAPSVRKRQYGDRRMTVLRRQRQLIKHLSILHWVLEQATAPIKPLLPSLRHIHYIEDVKLYQHQYVEDFNDAFNDFHYRLPLLIDLAHQNSQMWTPVPGKTAASAAPSAEAWNVRLRLDDANFNEHSPVEGLVEVYQWLARLASQGALFDLDVHLQERNALGFQPIPPVQGAVRLHIAQDPDDFPLYVTGISAIDADRFVETITGLLATRIPSGEGIPQTPTSINAPLIVHLPFPAATGPIFRQEVCRQLRLKSAFQIVDDPAGDQVTVINTSTGHSLCVGGIAAEEEGEHS